MTEVLESLFQDKAVVEAMSGLRVGEDANRGWRYPYYQWLDHVCQQRLTNPADREIGVMFGLGMPLLHVLARGLR